MLPSELDEIGHPGPRPARRFALVYLQQISHQARCRRYQAIAARCRADAGRSGLPRRFCQLHVKKPGFLPAPPGWPGGDGATEPL